MAVTIIQDWTDAEVPLRPGTRRDVRYRVYREGRQLFLEIRNPNDTPVHTLDIPDGMAMNQRNYEVLLRFALHNVHAA